MYQKENMYLVPSPVRERGESRAALMNPPLRSACRDRLEGGSSALWTLLRDAASQLLPSIRAKSAESEDGDPRHDLADDR